MEHYALFVLMSVLLIILPGPDTGVVTQNTVFHGRAGGMKTVLGSTSGLLIHTLAVVCGISAILVKSAFLFSVIKYVGAVYLLYLGLVSLWSLRNQETAAVDRPYAKHQSKSPFLQGFLTNVLNPKVAVFFLTFLPQFVKPGSYAFLQFFALGLTYTLLTVAWFFLYVQFIDRIRAWMKKASTQRAIQGITGLALVAFGITLALEKRP
ncbi:MULTISPECIES: LysE family translocator [Brevibacillus]|jgi:RhtB (resistance to homoserine/threonine) family protein|uniref:LysE family translocator n=1 Tax=Brevibacillus thermoruber TaxID=33942 RepID=A0A9X3Z296_9BACL|nr:MULTISPECIES: LysE family translocator [Brevibacillus]MDA5107536.1 LysE family translocator [Brevibacillus thermoruber]UYZ14177.1 LysE family translocator [Brevibacillus sp. WF146]